MTIIAMLDELAELRDQENVLRLDYAAMHASILAPVQAEIAALDAEYMPKSEAIATRIAEMETAVKAAVLAHGASVKGAHLHAIWTKGRVSWDSKKLDGLMIAVPQLKECRSEGAPSVSLRNI